MKPIALALSLVIVSCAPQPSSVQPAAQTTSVPSASPTPSLALQVPAERPTLKTWAIAPKDTDAEIGEWLDAHVVAFDPGVPPRGQLFLYLSVMLGTPADATLIVRQAAANGFHALGLSYPKLQDREICETNPDEGCYEKMRLEVIDGEDRTPLVTVTRANAIVNRLTKLLSHLAARFPADGWSAYLQGGAPRWAAIRVGGGSQGGSNVALIARDREVARVCLLEAPIDLIGAPGGARRLSPWIVPARSTPVDRYYGFRYVRSSSVNAAAFPLAWTAFGMDRFGLAVDTDTVKPPYGGSHHLTTNAVPIPDGRPNLEHRSMAVDRLTPKTASGQPVFAPVWQYACFS